MNSDYGVNDNIQEIFNQRLKEARMQPTIETVSRENNKLREQRDTLMAALEAMLQAQLSDMMTPDLNNAMNKATAALEAAK